MRERAAPVELLDAEADAWEYDAKNYRVRVLWTANACALFVIVECTPGFGWGDVVIDLGGAEHGFWCLRTPQLRLALVVALVLGLVRLVHAKGSVLWLAAV